MRRQHKAVLAASLALGLLAAACGGDDDDGDDDAGGRDGPAISIGAQDFGESAILAEIYGQALEAEGFEVRQQGLGGFRELLFDTFEAGDINLAPEYVASELEFLNGGAGEATGDVDETLAKLEPLLEERGLVAFEPADAVDTNSFVVTQETADELGLETLSDLAEKGQGLTLGAPQDCEENAFCLPGLERVYGLDLSDNFTPLEAGVIPTSLKEGAIDVALLFSTDGRIAEEGWVLLEDDQGMLAADNVVPVATQELVDAYGDDLAEVLNEVSAALTTEDLIELNRRYDIDKEDADDIAADWLRENDLD
ncbi:MAG TPA: ABC transporter substrate-binding protein [Acidimicrobiales bacterium]